jgi:enamine deaminase RidA (YjgF/YER057c/UK114 family)
VSGQAGIDRATGQLAGNTVQEQTRQCLKNVSAILDAAGSYRVRPRVGQYLGQEVVLSTS